MPGFETSLRSNDEVAKLLKRRKIYDQFKRDGTRGNLRCVVLLRQIFFPSLVTFIGRLDLDSGRLRQSFRTGIYARTIFRQGHAGRRWVSKTLCNSWKSVTTWLLSRVNMRRPTVILPRGIWDEHDVKNIKHAIVLAKRSITISVTRLDSTLSQLPVAVTKYSFDAHCWDILSQFQTILVLRSLTLVHSLLCSRD